MIISLCIILILIACSAFFSSSETALMGASKAKLHAMQKEGDQTAKRVIKLTEDPETLLGTILLGNNLVNIAASSIAAGLFLKLFGDAGLAYATLIMTFIVLIFAEVLPKTLANRNPEGYAKSISLPMQFLVIILRPMTKFVRLFSRGGMRLMGIKPDDDAPNFGEDDVKGAIGLGLHHGVLDSGEHRMLDSVMGLDELTVRDVMTHRSMIISMDSKIPDHDVKEFLANSSYSRIPVWENEYDNIIGILHIKDYYRAIRNAKKSGERFEIKDIVSDPFFIPETANVSDLLKEFRMKRKHLALVVDEYGDMQGIISLEDILEEIVGDIEDEHDPIKATFTEGKKGSIIATANYPVRDLNKELGFEIPDDDAAVTLGGLVTETLGRIPSVAEKVNLGNYELTVLAKRRQALLKVRVRKLRKEED